MSSMQLNDFMKINGFPIFETAKELITKYELDVRYIRKWTTEAVTSAEIHISHPFVKHITIGRGPRYSGRMRIAVCLKDLSTFEKLYGKLTKKNSSTYVRYDEEGLQMLQNIRVKTELDTELSDSQLIAETDSVAEGDWSATDKLALIKQRIGHSSYARKVKARAGNRCQINSVITRNLIASHIKPWAESELVEKTDIENGLCLSPNYDGLFEDGLISFSDDGVIIISQMLSAREMSAYRLTGKETINVSTRQSKYLRWHRRKWGFHS